MIRLYTWNVNGIRAVHKKGFLGWLQAAQPDMLGLQEIKASPDQLSDDLRSPSGYHAYWASATRKGYSGVALFTRAQPNSISLGLGIPEYDDEGRTIVAEYDDFVFITAYFPNGGRDHSRIPYKMAYKAAFLDYCNKLRAAGKSVVFCGDVNTSHQPIDLARPRENEKKTGFMPEERVWIDQVIEAGYVDIFRARNPTLAGAYTWWTAVGGARSRNVGWRLDYFFISPDLLDAVVDCQIHADVLGSDHCPVSLTLDFGR
jgi:exodeoxyribonuclease-3